MGFRAPIQDSRVVSILPDHATCEWIDPALSAIELIESVDDHCYSDLVDQVEFEIDRTFTGSGLGILLQEWFSTSSPSSIASSIEYLEIVERPIESFASQSTSFSARLTARVESTLSETDIAEIELDRRFGSASSTEGLLEGILERIRSTSAWPVDLIEVSETEVN
jgi:hypothetical protein